MNLRLLLNLKEDVKKIGLFGLGRSSLALLDILPENAEITLRSDVRVNPATLAHDRRITRIYDGEHSCDSIREQVIFFSPSVRRDRPALASAKARGVVFSSDCELFFMTNTSPVYAVTGSNGKSTTATLMRELLTESYGDVTLCGNIGAPFMSSSDAEAYVCELSSFQLTYSTPFTERAAITNITPNHLNWHDSFEEYKSTKLSLLSHTRGAVLNIDDPILSDHARRHGAFSVVSSVLRYEEIRQSYDIRTAYTLESGNICRSGVPFIRARDLYKREGYNVKNFMLALAICDGSVSSSHAVRVGREFRGLSHRCEHFATLRGVDFFDSSIDTSPERTEMTLMSLARECIVILGGRSKGLPFSELLPALKKHAKLALLYGECAGELHEMLGGAVPSHSFATLGEATEYAMRLAVAGDAVILSPAATSYDAFSSFEERGEYFKKKVNEYKF